MKDLIKTTLLLLALLLPAAATAYDIEVDGIYYNINGNNATVTYKGDNPDLYDEYSGTVTIPNSVTRNGRTYSVTAIGDWTFGNCRGLTNVTIPNSVTAIGNAAFSGCSGLMSVTIPDSVTTIGDGAFYSCSGLTSVTIPNSVTYIGYAAFKGCSSLTSATIPNSVTTIGHSAFYGCSGLTSVTIPNSVTYIGYAAFKGCSSLTSVTIPNSVTTIIYDTFYGCSSLTSVTIPNSVTAIDNAAFYGCSSLMSVTIPNSVTTIGDIAFSDCSGLTKLAVENGNNKYDSRDNCNAIIETATNKLIAGCQNTVIPNSVTAIGDYAFHGCSSLTSVTIPNSVTTIGFSAFSSCSGLMSVTIPNSVTTIGNYAFYGCSGLMNVTIPNSVTTIGNWTFCNCRGLTNVTIPNSVTTIGYAAFSDCRGLTSVTIPNSVTTIGDKAFSGCSGLTSVTIPNSVTTIGINSFYGCSGLMSVTIPNSVTTIGNAAFFGCSSLMSVIIPNSVTAIGDYAFSDCRDLTNVYCHITDLSRVSVGEKTFRNYYSNDNYSGRTLHVPQGTAAAYQADENWYPYFGQIVEMEPITFLRGDVNLDGEVNISDINAVADIIMGATLDAGTLERADVNEDGNINISDVNEIINIILFPVEPEEHDWVDLGLPSGTLWATCNVGAHAPEQRGHFYAWGETKPKRVYSWENYKWGNSNDGSLTKYCTSSQYGTVDNKIELDPKDDAAHVNWGPEWRMPTDEQIDELRRCCNSIRAEVNGVKGRLITGPNGNTIFLPGTGEWGNGQGTSGYSGRYWSRKGRDQYALGMLTDAGNDSWGFFSDYRCNGHTIRPVRTSPE